MSDSQNYPKASKRAMSVRIWHQSYTDLKALPGYAQMLADHAARICGPDVEVELHGVDPGTYPHGFMPVDVAGFEMVRALMDQQIIRNCMRAEQQGFDAVAISCFVDPGLELARSLVDIPVVSSCQTSLLVAATMGTRFGLIGLDRNMVNMLTGLVNRYGFRDQVIRITSPEPQLRENELDEAFADPSNMVERLTQESAKLIAAGADVIIPAEGVLSTLLVHGGVQRVHDVPVLDSYGALLGYALMLVQLQQRSGLRAGRTGPYARPPTDLLRHVQRAAAVGWDE
jgi:allantoin racemase